MNNKRNCEIQKLSNRIRMLEDDLAAQQQVKLGFFKFKEKRIAQENLDANNQRTHRRQKRVRSKTGNLQSRTRQTP